LQTESVVTPSAVAGLGETGIVRDSDLVKGFLKHRHSRVRRMAIRSICKLQPPHFVDTVIETLFKDTQGVAAVAESCVAKHIREVAAAPLWDRAVSLGDVDRQVRVLRVFRQLSKWDRLECLLRSVATSADIREFALKELDDWSNHFNTNFTTPTPAQHSTLRALLTQVKMIVSPVRVGDIEFVLKHG